MIARAGCVGVVALSSAVPLLAASAARADAPLNYLEGAGARAYPVVALTWGLAAISVVVVVVITALVVTAAWRARRGPIEAAPVERGGDGMAWVYWGVGISSVVLLGSLVWTVAVLAAVNGPGRTAALTIEVTGQQWWWKIRYLSDDPSQTVTTANEIHIPTGAPVRVKLIGADVIHSFWVPALSGKTDTIPGQTNESWIEADRPGTYRGQCTEYCGQQHAHMGFLVVAQPPSDFAAWREAQLAPAATPATPETIRGEAGFRQHCGACHTVRGTLSGGTVAPDLTHLMSRQTIAAATLANDPASLTGWIYDPQEVKPGTRMPDLALSGDELQDIRTFLDTLK